MKKIFLTAVVALMTTTSVCAQSEPKSDWTLNTSGWCTNYFTTLIYSAITETVEHFALRGVSKKDSLWTERIIPSAGLVFPIGMSKHGFEGADIYGPYHYAFGNPFKHIGDYAIGLDASYKHSFLGLYAGAYFKSQEIVFKETEDDIRGFYIQPRLGMLMGSSKYAFEAGMFYDIPTGCGGSVADTDRDRLQGGLGLDFSLSKTDKSGNGKYILMFSMPLHNFFNTNYAGQENLKRKVGYIMLTRRVCL